MNIVNDRVSPVIKNSEPTGFERPALLNSLCYTDLPAEESSMRIARESNDCTADSQPVVLVGESVRKPNSYQGVDQLLDHRTGELTFVATSEIPPGIGLSGPSDEMVHLDLSLQAYIVRRY